MPSSPGLVTVFSVQMMFISQAHCRYWTAFHVQGSWVSMLIITHCGFLLEISLFNFLKIFCVSWMNLHDLPDPLLCLLLESGSNLQNLHTLIPTKQHPTGSLKPPSRISHIPQHTAHAVTRNTLSICLRACSYCSGGMAVAEKCYFKFFLYLYTPYTVFLLYFSMSGFFLSWYNLCHGILFISLSLFLTCFLVQYPFPLSPSVYIVARRRIHYLLWELGGKCCEMHNFTSVVFKAQNCTSTCSKIRVFASC